MKTPTNPAQFEKGLSRRWFLALLASTACSPKKLKAIASAAPFVKSKENWTANDYHNFLKALPNDARLLLKKTSGLLKEDADETQLKSAEIDALDIQKQALWLSSNILTYPFKDEANLNYHELTKWACLKAEVPDNIVQSASTFALERELHMLLFAGLWDKLTPKQREEMMVKLDPNEKIKNKAAIAALGGASAVAALSTTVALTGFAFYTTMSVTIATVASVVGVTLPFAGYAGASALVGILSGPVGWAIMAAGALGGIALMGSADVQKTTALICQTHALKVEALIAAGEDEKSVFGI